MVPCTQYYDLNRCPITEALLLRSGEATGAPGPGYKKEGLSKEAEKKKWRAKFSCILKPSIHCSHVPSALIGRCVSLFTLFVF